MKTWLCAYFKTLGKECYKMGPDGDPVPATSAFIIVGDPFHDRLQAEAYAARLSHDRNDEQITIFQSVCVIKAKPTPYTADEIN